MANWFVTIGTEERGPCVDAQLRQLALSGKLKTTDLIRREEMRQPIEASKVKGLFDVPASPPASHMIPADEVRSVFRRHRRKSWSPRIAIAVAGLCLLGLLVNSVPRNSLNMVAPAQSSAAAIRKQLRQEVTQYLPEWKELLSDRQNAAKLRSFKALWSRWGELLSQRAKLMHAGGITYLIDGDDHFIGNPGQPPKVIVIPKDFRSNYYGGSAGPNEVVVSGMFRFVGNVTGRNALGMSITMEKYECDPDFTQDRDTWDELENLARWHRDVSGNENLEGVDRFLRAVAGE
ncbi:DUF4339 domain-containing protein [Lacipirellula sp.]|uniref:DUF4339 domain-containing protein n=1 Tax=Lacipirellula sp. TaxID=2691419 RepID=UPI003D1318B8